MSLWVWSLKYSGEAIGEEPLFGKKQPATAVKVVAVTGVFWPPRVEGTASAPVVNFGKHNFFVAV